MSRLTMALILILVFHSCKVRDQDFKTDPRIFIEEVPWEHKDIELDSIAGVGLERAYNELIKNKKGNKVLVAIIDTQVDINHEDLKNQIYENSKEIKDNNLDDDNNGFVDDIHGWNFLGYDSDESVYYASMDHIRIIRRLQEEFLNLDSTQISPNRMSDFKKYHKALEARKNEIANAKKRADYGKRLWEAYRESRETFSEVFVNDNISLKEIESIEPKNDREVFLLKFLRNVEFYYCS